LRSTNFSSGFSGVFGGCGFLKNRDNIGKEEGKGSS